MKKVLVIGANSYIGKKFYEYIKREKENEIYIDMVSASDGGWRKADFTQYDSILHLAAIVHKKEKRNMKELYDQVNYKLAVEVAKKAKENKVNQFIFMSTAAIFGYGTSCITYDTTPKPITLYGKSKLAAENEITKLKDINFKVAVVRPPMVYGDGCSGNYARLVKLAKCTPIFPDYHNKRSAIKIVNLCEIVSNIILREFDGYFHPQDKEYMDTCKEVTLISNYFGKKVKLVKIPVFVMKGLIYILPPFKKMFGNYYYEVS